MSQQTNQQIADQLIAKINTGESPFQVPGMRMPLNPLTGKAYRGMNALWLAMQDRTDPRWMTLKQASNRQGLKIATGSKGTLISFLKTTDRVQLLDDKGNPQLNTRGNPKTDLIKLAHPVEREAYVFNGEQIEGIQPLNQFLATREKFQAEHSPGDQLAKLVELSGANVETTTGEPGYDPGERIIYMPEIDDFASEQQYNAALLFELVKFAGHDKELFDPMDVSTAESIRPAIAALLLGSEIGVHSQLAPQLVPDDILLVAESSPEELEKAANSAQYVMDYLIGLEIPRDRKQTVANERYLQVGDLIDYNETRYEVMGKGRNGDLQVMDKATENRFRVAQKDGLYSSLLAARNEARKPQQEQAQLAAQEQVMGPEEELDHSMEHEHADELEHEEGSNLDFSEEYEDFPRLELSQEEDEDRNSGMKR